MPSRALVLGGGGTVGVAWETGIVAALLAEGVPLLEADLILGTSAGSIVGAQIASGRDPLELLESQLAFTPVAPRPSRFASIAYPFAVLTTGARGLTARKPFSQAIGAFARVASRRSESSWVQQIQDTLQVASWPERYACTVIDTRSGAFRVLDASVDVDLARGVAASCSVPGVFPPVTIDGHRYMDGGLRTATNADAIGSYDVVVVLSVATRTGLPGRLAARALDREVALLRARGGRVLTITPNRECIHAMGTMLMNNGRRAASSAAGYRQGIEEAQRILEAWRVQHLDASV